MTSRRGGKIKGGEGGMGMRKWHAVGAATCGSIAAPEPVLRHRMKRNQTAPAAASPMRTNITTSPQGVRSSPALCVGRKLDVPKTPLSMIFSLLNLWQGMPLASTSKCMFRTRDCVFGPHQDEKWGHKVSVHSVLISVTPSCQKTTMMETCGLDKIVVEILYVFLDFVN